MYRVLTILLVLGLAAALGAGCGGSTGKATSPTTPASQTMVPASPTATPTTGGSLTPQQHQDVTDGVVLISTFFKMIDIGQFATAEKMLASPSLWDKKDLYGITSLRLVSTTPLRINADGSVVFSTNIRRTPKSQAGGPYFPNFVTVARDAQGKLAITALATSP
jgi:hypothetical protein